MKYVKKNEYPIDTLFERCYNRTQLREHRLKKEG